MDDREIAVLLGAYETAQENAHHTDTVVWEAAAIIWSANALLMGFILEAVSSTKLRVHILIAVSSILGMGMSLFLLASFPRLKRTMQICWNTCQLIERKLKMEFKLHCDIHEDYKQTAIRMRILYYVLSWLFVAGWLAFLTVSVCHIVSSLSL